MYILKENINLNFDLINNYIENKLDELNLKYSKKLNSFSLYRGYIDIIKLVDNSFLVKIDVKIEVSSISLADPKKNYQTTSARIVKHERIKKDIDINEEKDLKKIDSVLNKIKSKI